ncbi:MAG: LLM class flavin-dependent oxidoreductase [Paracoccus sp. (in: a-proteobacteria)]|jgi:alkanesulfonate monooxygenase|uniref:LLM class flavin-dependent oxidoreductase n=1 Tax=unclassified Paracoccus (in: a-proteobacteria) TaxID=2688777 RepID=UPI000C541980|nr:MULTISPECIES: LLM class flavin-dependent oxidoreductase [unclassified Paracoccus (in: a-proteobacteria)]MAN55238.1 alkanesulfonate monooxygenase [Paracoccus sp. (in: a-proteobacteria)]MBA47886.1 alkanesulfonate monooxygenase [Paracoccus sp. (in: a-proteobacteria)]MCS5603477.1 LLM class flavin-dependent oxidoreductase [Paracoccus sp. (in: a-proteobacteria)]MDB2550968.1 LLM class flavin-dependent oxidoreductase [Paracoccus sp. (in: a-proteobacteria)]HIC65601.1 LLM class flavin-dependent oxido|tara:strand:- start:2415 stop:3569 length:1155 start_codon:yes stop_codon:yes gene_type:complete
MTIVPVTSADLDAVEVAWFSALCSDDYQFLGVPDGDLRSSWDHCSDIVKTAEAQGFGNILCPSSYQVGQDTLSFVAGCAPITERINLLAAVRCGEMQPIMLARTIATLDHMLQGRLTVNIISSDFPGQKEDSKHRYKRSREVVEILKQAWSRDQIDYEGEVYSFAGLTTDPAKPYQQGGPMLYFGGYSPDALDLCGQHCDVYLMWPEKTEDIAARMKAAHEAAERYGRTLDYGFRAHVIVRDTEAEARDYARYIASKLDDELGQAIRERALDAGSLGVSHQARNRELADLEGYVEPNLWTGVGRARSGCGAAIVGSTDQVLSKLEELQGMGIRAFILSGYPHLDEAEHFGSRVLPQMKTCQLNRVRGRVPDALPRTPLGAGVRR